jgi:ribosomal-protein-alanine N-acetyltransferase
MILGPARPEHAPAMALTHAEGFEIGWSPHDIVGCLTAPGGFGLIAAEDGGQAAGVAGFVLARVMAGEAEILTLAVAPRCRRRGVGRALLDAASLMAEQRGAQAMFLEVASDNAAALALYVLAGFSQAGVRRGYYRRPGRAAGDALVLRRALNSAPT